MDIETATKNTSKSDLAMIHIIADRASKLFKMPVLQVEMDIVLANATHPLRLDDFLKAERMDFAHDVYGIQKNLDRATGELKNFFTPRFSGSNGNDGGCS